jgi:hypothetical protein
MGKFSSGALFGVGLASLATWLTRRLDFVMVQDQVKQQVQARWDREALDRALANARTVVVSVRSRRRPSGSAAPDLVEVEDSSAPLADLESPVVG